MIKRWFALAAAALTVFLCAGIVSAEDENTAEIFTYPAEPWLAPLSTAEEIPPHLPSTNLSETAAETEPVEYAEAMAIMREAMLNREDHVTISFLTKPADLETKAQGIYDWVFAHGISPEGGDYLRFMTNVWEEDGKYSVKSMPDGNYSVTGTFLMTYYTTAEEEAYVDEEVEKLVDEWKELGLNEYQTIRTIYDYIVDTVEYDYSNLSNSAYKRQFTAYAALHDKTAVCQGYASLFYRLALEMGVDARMICGTQINHAWNIAELDGTYYNFDATWDDTSKSNPYRYFFRGSAAFGDHPCDGQYLTEEFMTAHPISEADYDPSVPADEMTWTLSEDGVLEIHGAGKMPDYEWEGENTAPWQDSRDLVRLVRVGCGEGDQITYIGAYSFCRMENLTEIEIADTVVSFGHKILDDSGLTSFTFPASVSDLYDGALSGMSGVNAFAVEEGSEHFKAIDGVIYTKNGLEIVAYPGGRDDGSYTVPEGVTDIRGHAFEGAGFTSVVLPESLLFIGGCAFNGSSLTEATIPAGVTFMDTYVFDNSRNLTSVKFLGDMPEIGEGFNNVHESFHIVCRIDADGWADSVFAEAGILRYFGDVSGDGVLDTSDTDLLTRYFAGWKVQIDPAVLDFNNDGETNRKDAMILARKIAGWDIQ